MCTTDSNHMFIYTLKVVKGGGGGDVVEVGVLGGGVGGG